MRLARWTLLALLVGLYLALVLAEGTAPSVDGCDKGEHCTPLHTVKH